MSLVDRINEVREYYKLSGNALAVRIDMKYTTIYNYLNGKDPSVEFLMRLKSTFTDIDMNWLFTGEGSMLLSKEVTNDKLIKELADTKTELLIQKGVTDRLCNILEERLGNKEEIKGKRSVG